MNLNARGQVWRELDRVVHRWTAEYAVGHSGLRPVWSQKLAGSVSQAGRLAINVPLVRDGRTWSPAGGETGECGDPAG